MFLDLARPHAALSAYKKTLELRQKLDGVDSPPVADVCDSVACSYTEAGDVEQAFEDGYLYIENYGEGDDYFESEEVNDYVFRFVNTLPTDIKCEYVERLQELLNNAGYSTFMSVGRKLSKLSSKKGR